MYAGIPLPESIQNLYKFDNNLITPVGRAVGDKQSQVFAIKYNWKNIANELDAKKITTEAEATAIGNFFDNPTKYPLPEELKVKIGDELLNRIKTYKSFLTEEQVSRGLLESTINDDEYLRTFIVQLDNKPPTPVQMNALKESSSASLTARLFGIRQNEGVSGLSTKNRYDNARKFENADLRDRYLEQFGLKTNRNFFDVMRKTVNQVSSITSNYDFVQSLRTQAKQGITGVKEIYDPVVFKQFKEDTIIQFKAIRDNILEDIKNKKLIVLENNKNKKLITLEDAKNKKLIIQEEYDEAKSKTNDIIENSRIQFKETIKLIGAEPSEKFILLLQKQELDQEIKTLQENLFIDMKNKKQIISAKGKKRFEDIRQDIENSRESLNSKAIGQISKVRQSAQNKIIAEVDKISKRYAEALVLGLRRPRDMRIAQQMTGLMFDETSANAIDHIFEKLKPSSLEDLIRGMKLFVATGDLFQLPEVVRQRFGVNGLRGLGGAWHYTPKQFYEKGITATRRGLVLGKPADIDIEIIRKMGLELEELEKSNFRKAVEKIGETVEKIPVVGKGAEITKKSFQLLETLQWEVVLPHTKLAMWEQVSAKMKRSNPKLTQEEAETMSAKFVNDTFQGLNWERIMSEDSTIGKALNKNIIRATRYAFFGPDRLASIFNRYTKGFGKNGGEYRKFWIRAVIAGIIITETLNYLFNGKSTLENRKGNKLSVELPFMKDEKGNPMAVNVIGTWAEPYRFIEKPTNYVLNKMGLIPRVLGVGYQDYPPKTFTEFIIKNQPVPFTIQNLTGQLVKSEKLKTGEVSLPVALGQAGLEFTGFPTVFRTGKSKVATFNDLLNQKATVWEYLTSQTIKPPTEKSLTEMGELEELEELEELK
jgi:hypothetical protein